MRTIPNQTVKHLHFSDLQDVVGDDELGQSALGRFGGDTSRESEHPLQLVLQRLLTGLLVHDSSAQVDLLRKDNGHDLAN